jgi:hypothetical protein
METLIKDLELHGAELWHVLYERVGQPELAGLVTTKILRDLETPLGRAVVLGAKGRELMGKDSSYKISPDVAASSVLRRRVREKLVADGWIFVDYKGKKKQLMQFKRASETLYVSCTYPDPSPKTIEHYHQRFLFYTSDTRLLFTALEAKRYKNLLKKYPNLVMLEVNLLLPPLGE